jgi:hypothetical protein
MLREPFLVVATDEANGDGAVRAIAPHAALQSKSGARKKLRFR